MLLDAETKGQEYLLKHPLFMENGQPIKDKWISFSFPPYWFYDVLTALEYFRGYKSNRDSRIHPGIDLLIEKQNKDGSWNLGSRHPGKSFFEMEVTRVPSRWNTLRALRVQKWWKE